MKETSSQGTLWMLGVRRENRAGKLLKNMAGTTGLEPAASAVTGQRSNQLNYVPGRSIRQPT